MKAAVVEAKGKIGVQDIPKPELKPNEVLVKVKVSGVCGSDIPRVLEGTSHYFPNVLGHEFSGEVVALGSAVGGDSTDAKAAGSVPAGLRNASLSSRLATGASLAVGDRVSVAPLKPCHACTLCKEGNYALCGNYSFIGSREYGGWAEYVKTPIENIIALGDTDYLAGAFVEPVSVALHGIYAMGIQPTDSVAIIGVGTIGLLTFQAVRAMGVTNITVFDVNPESLAKAKTLGATRAVISTDSEAVQTAIAESAIAQVGGAADQGSAVGKKTSGFDHVLETAGAPAAEKMALAIAGNKGSIMFIGTPKIPLTLNPKEFEHINRKELTLRGSWMSYSAPFPGKEWTQAVELLQNGDIQVEPLIDRTIGVEKIAEAFADIDAGKVSGKVLIQFDA